MQTDLSPTEKSPSFISAVWSLVQMILYFILAYKWMLRCKDIGYGKGESTFALCFAGSLMLFSGGCYLAQQVRKGDTGAILYLAGCVLVYVLLGGVNLLAIATAQDAEEKSGKKA